jgi:hypothetical protein
MMHENVLQLQAPVKVRQQRTRVRQLPTVKQGDVRQMVGVCATNAAKTPPTGGALAGPVA